jgi:hypothetical protein
MWQLDGFYPRKTAQGIVVVHASNRRPVEQPELRGPFNTRDDAWRAIHNFVLYPSNKSANRRGGKP